ncbi:hypothetical protein Dimus_029826 [Dionaea muscipula]
MITLLLNSETSSNSSAQSPILPSQTLFPPASSISPFGGTAFSPKLEDPPQIARWARRRTTSNTNRVLIDLCSATASFWVGFSSFFATVKAGADEELQWDCGEVWRRRRMTSQSLMVVGVTAIQHCPLPTGNFAIWDFTVLGSIL